MPQVQSAQKKAQEIYGGSLAPHVEKASLVVEPYFGRLRNSALTVHHNHIMPAFDTSKPYFRQAYGASEAFVLATGIPYAKWAWSSLVIFVDGTLWPQVRALYGDNVKPQLVMISERIAKYQEGRKLKASMNKVESSISAASRATKESTSLATPEIIPETPTHTGETGPAKTSPTSEEQIAAAREQVATDLHTWQEKFAKAADKGSEDLQERVKDIIDGLIKSEIDGEGRRLMTALNKTVEKEIIGFKSKLIKIVAGLPNDSSSSEDEAAEKEALDTIRQSANSIRDRASAIRQWYAKFEANIGQRADAAADSTLDVLDGIRDLGLQEIGMRWAWMDGVTYKDWAKYHQLKKQFDNWRNEVREVATKHEVLEKARKSGESLLEDAMDTASGAAMELVRLKDVGKWKIHAHDSTDNFDSRIMPAGAASAASKVVNNIKGVSQSLVESSRSTTESIVGKAYKAASEAAATASSAMLGSTHGGLESVPSMVSEAAAEVINSASSVATASSQGYVESVGSEVTRSIAAMASDGSAALADASGHGAMDGVASSAQSIAGRWGEFSDSAGNSVASAASQIPNIVSSAWNPASSISSVASSASGKVFAGAMAQKVTDSTPILDDVIDDSDEATFSNKMQSVLNGAGDKYADITRAVSEALLGTSQGTVESFSSVANEQYSNALAAASSVLYGTTQGAAESITSVASERYSQAVSA